MIVCDSGPEPEPDIGGDSVNVWKLSTVISVSVKKLDQLNLVFL